MSTATRKAGSIRRAPRGVLTLSLTALIALAGGCGSSSKSSSSSSTPSSPAAAPTTSSPAAAPTTSSSATATTPAPASGGQTLSVAANPEGQLTFNTTSLTAKAGQVKIDFTNAASLGHNLTVASASGAVVGATPTFQGGTKTLSLSLKPGTYKFYCSVPGHRAGGMEGTLTVQ
jgi:plastocyanin